MVQHEEIQNAFCQAGLRCTRQRYAVYAALAASKEHPTAEELFLAVRNELPGLSLATVYNSLDALVDACMAQKLPGGPSGSARFDASCADHVHLRDQRTGKISDAPDELSSKVHDCVPREVLQQIANEFNFEIEHIQIELVGRFRRK